MPNYDPPLSLLTCLVPIDDCDFVQLQWKCSLEHGCLLCKMVQDPDNLGERHVWHFKERSCHDPSLLTFEMNDCEAQSYCHIMVRIIAIRLGWPGKWLMPYSHSLDLCVVDSAKCKAFACHVLVELQSYLGDKRHILKLRERTFIR